MTTHTAESVLAEFERMDETGSGRWQHEEVTRMAVALAEARNRIDLQDKQIREVAERSGRDVMFWRDQCDVRERGLKTVEAELARVRPIVDAARECATRRLDTGLMTALHILAQSIHAADADASTDLTTVTPSVGGAVVKDGS